MKTAVSIDLTEQLYWDSFKGFAEEIKIINSFVCLKVKCGRERNPVNLIGEKYAKTRK